MDISSFFPSFGTDLILYLFYAFIAFIVGREIVTWYLKLNKITDLLEKIEGHLSKNQDKIKPQSDPNTIVH